MPHSPHAGTIEQSGGTDVYRIEVTSDKPIVVISSTGPLDTKGWISRGPEKAVSLPIVQDDDSGVGFNFRLEAELDPGTYYIGVTSRDPGEYFVHFDTYRVVDLEQQVSATIDTPDDVHYFIASVPEESSLRLETHGAIHTDVSLLRKTGESSLTRVPIDEDSGAYEALTPGKYYIRVTGSDKGRYDLHLSRYIILSSSIKKITRGYTGVDLFQVNVTNDRPYITVYTTGALDTEGFVRVGPVIVPDDGMHVAGGGDDDSGHHSNFRISTHLEGGKYLIEVRWRSKAETAEYSIYFTAHRTPKDLHGNHRYEATRIASVGRSDFAGSISPDDRDVFSLELKQPAVLQAYSDSDAIEVVREDPEGLTHPNFGAPLVIGTGVHNFWAEDSFESGNDWYRLSFQVDPLEMLVSSSEGWMVHDFDADYFLFTVTDDFPAVRIYTTGEGAPYICVYTLLDDGTIEEDTSSQCGNSVGVLLESGRYIAVLSTSVAVGAYTVHIVAEPHETFGSSQATAIDLGGLGYAARGWLYGTDDVDWYLFEVQPEIPWISMQIDADRHVDVTAQLIGPDASGGDPVIASWNGGERFGLQVPPGRYLVAVRGVGGGEYSIDLDSGSVPVPLQSGAQSVLAPESTDVYSLGIAKRTLLELSGTVENARIELWHPRADGHVRVSSYNGDFRAMRILDAGSYLITATTDGVGLYSFALNMLEMSSDDYGWDPLQAVQLDGTLEGTLLPWDLDTFRIDVSEDQSLISIRHNSTDDVFVFLLKTATITTPSWKQGILENYELIATDIWNANLSRRLDAGTYYVAIASVDTAVDYSVHAAVSDVPRDHHGGDPTDATPLTSTHMGWIQSDDLDYFRFVVTDAESWVKIRITDNLTDDTIDNVGRFTVGQLIRHEEGEEALFMGQDLHPYPTRDVDLYAIYGLPGVEDLGISKLLESGTYYVKIQSIATAARHDALFHIGNSEFLETWPIDIGSYAIDLTIEDVPEDDHADELHGATVLTDVTKGWIGGDHIDYFRFVVPDSQPAAMIHIVGALQVKVTILKRTEDDDPVEITSAEGTPADGTSVGMELEPGTYYVRVETFAPRAAGPYKIHLHPVRGDGTTTGG